MIHTSHYVGNVIVSGNSVSSLFCNKLNVKSVEYILTNIFGKVFNSAECYIVECPFHDDSGNPNGSSPFGWCGTGMCGYRDVEEW